MCSTRDTTRYSSNRTPGSNSRTWGGPQSRAQYTQDTQSHPTTTTCSFVHKFQYFFIQALERPQFSFFPSRESKNWSGLDPHSFQYRTNSSCKCWLWLEPITSFGFPELEGTDLYLKPGYFNASLLPSFPLHRLFQAFSGLHKTSKQLHLCGTNLDCLLKNAWSFFLSITNIITTYWISSRVNPPFVDSFKHMLRRRFWELVEAKSQKFWRC